MSELPILPETGVDQEGIREVSTEGLGRKYYHPMHFPTCDLEGTDVGPFPSGIRNRGRRIRCDIEGILSQNG